MGESTADISQWLKERCKSKNLSIRGAATKTGLSHATIADIINGATLPSPETIKRLAQAFGEDGNEKLALEDSLLILAGYRTKRPNGQDISEPMARLMDKVADFDEDQLKLMAQFAEYLANMEKK